MQLAPTEEQLMIQDTARQFADTELAPNAAALDETLHRLLENALLGLNGFELRIVAADSVDRRESGRFLTRAALHCVGTQVRLDMQLHGAGDLIWSARYLGETGGLPAIVDLAVADMAPLIGAGP